MTIKQAIERSVSHTEIVSLEWTLALEEDLTLAAEDYVDTGRVFEAWGKDEGGSEWRVHLIRTAPDED